MSAKYQVIYADPPWQYGNKSSRGAASNHYSTMTLDELKRIPVWDLAADNAVLAMWYTGTHDAQAKRITKKVTARIARLVWLAVQQHAHSCGGVLGKNYSATELAKLMGIELNNWSTNYAIHWRSILMVCQSLDNTSLHDTIETRAANKPNFNDVMLAKMNKLSDI